MSTSTLETVPIIPLKRVPAADIPVQRAKRGEKWVFMLAACYENTGNGAGRRVRPQLGSPVFVLGGAVGF